MAWVCADMPGYLSQASLQAINPSTVVMLGHQCSRTIQSVCSMCAAHMHTMQEEQTHPTGGGSLLHTPPQTSVQEHTRQSEAGHAILTTAKEQRTCRSACKTSEEHAPFHHGNGHDSDGDLFIHAITRVSISL